ncbi:hypothetical protein Q9L58_010081 [Maublancomyces gigas]|uniref:Uncharacterized protein n=1 Tax=Discina gigas TaxID=1032678 RepID=A0ABR3G544_9PEZI
MSYQTTSSLRPYPKQTPAILPMTRAGTISAPTEITSEDEIFWFSVFECLVRPPKVDFMRLAACLGYSDSDFAATMFGVKRRQMWAHIGKLMRRHDVDKSGGELASSAKRKSGEDTDVGGSKKMAKGNHADDGKNKPTVKGNLGHDTSVFIRAGRH